MRHEKHYEFSKSLAISNNMLQCRFLINLKWTNPLKKQFPHTWGFQLNVRSTKKNFISHLIRHILSLGVIMTYLCRCWVANKCFSLANNIVYRQSEVFYNQDLRPIDPLANKCCTMLTIIQSTRGCFRQNQPST